MSDDRKLSANAALGARNLANLMRKHGAKTLGELQQVMGTTTEEQRAAEVATFIATTGQIGQEADPDVDHRVVILDGEEEAMHWLTKAEAVALANRIKRLAEQLPERRVLRRVADTEQHLRALD